MRVIAPVLVLAAALVAAPRALQKPSPVAIQVAFDEWQTPDQPAFAHDVALAPDGTIWYTAQRANVLGRFHPQTAAFDQYKLPTPNSGPHGLVANKDGEIWYSGNSAALIGRVDPETGKVLEFKMADPAAKDPHTLAFDRNGALWFTVQEGNFVGQLQPKTTRVALLPLPAANARPYDIKINSKDVPFFVEFGTNAVGSVEPATMKITEYRLKNSAARPRRMAIAPDDSIYYTDYARGFLGHLNPITGAFDEHRAPGGPASRPYAIAMTADGAVWFCETGVPTRNVLVRFDPRTGRMQSWPIPSGGHTVRYMVAAPDGSLWLAESGIGKIARARVKKTDQG